MQCAAVGESSELLHFTVDTSDVTGKTAYRQKENVSFAAILSNDYFRIATVKSSQVRAANISLNMDIMQGRLKGTFSNVTYIPQDT